VKTRNIGHGWVVLALLVAAHVIVVALVVPLVPSLLR